ncbi:MAG TPA: protein-disulfide reductase DsbD domain-containing protein [Thermoanaerobaculia bacterium]|nr:protein-disulfide reductase DsbD domain-containing protein [Thermoanaerobaculia bacterium]
MLRKASILVLLAALLAPLHAWGAASEWAENEQSRVRLITPWQVAPASGELRMGLHFTLSPGWHVYWKNSGDAGFPPVVVFEKAPGLGEPELLWPAPERFELPGNLVAFGYEDEVVYPIRMPIRASLQPQGDRLRLVADVDYLVCEVDCIPYRYSLALDQPLGPPVPDSATAPLIDRGWASLPAPASLLPGVTTTAALDVSRPGAPALEVRVQGASPGEGSDLFLESHEGFDTGKPVARKTEDGVLYRVPLKPREEGKVPFTTTVAWTVTNLVRDGQPVSLESRQQIGRKEAEAQPASFDSLNSSPVLTALLAVASALLALGLWGLLTSGSSESQPRMLLGFAAAAVTIGLLYALSRQIRPEGLAAVELTLLAMGLCAWLRRRSEARRALRIGLVVALLGCALAAPWLAGRHRIPGDITDSQA